MQFRTAFVAAALVAVAAAQNSTISNASTTVSLPTPTPTGAGMINTVSMGGLAMVLAGAIAALL